MSAHELDHDARRLFDELVSDLLAQGHDLAAVLDALRRIADDGNGWQPVLGEPSRADLDRRPSDLRGDADDEPEWVKLRRSASSPAGLQAIKHGVVLRDPGADPTLQS